MSDNPFQAPQKITPGGPAGIQPSLGRGYVTQVPVIGILLIVQGLLLLLFGLMSIGFVFLFNNFDALPGAQPPRPEDEMAMTVMVWIYGVYAGLTIPLAVLHFVAGYYALNFRGRICGIATMILGLASMLTCYCAPTSIGMAVYGMIIFFNPAVIEAFAMGNLGMKKHDILAKFPH